MKLGDMEPPKGILATVWNFICFLPFFIGLLLLGIVKGAFICPWVCLIITIGNSAIILGLWPVHVFWTYYCILRAKLLGPVLKLVLCIFLPIPLMSWPLLGIVGSVIGGLAYGFLSPIFATVNAVGEGKSDKFFHCIYDGTYSTIKRGCTVVRDLRDVCFHSYFSVMDDLHLRAPPAGKYYEIRLLYLLGAIVLGVLGIFVDMPVISCVALFKGPYMLFKGWHRLFHDLIGREGPFLETICVPFAGLAILLWPLAVVGAVLGSMLSSLFLGTYAGVVTYQESSFWFGLCYIVASLSIYDEYSNDVLDMPEGSCFPRPQYRKGDRFSRTDSLSFSGPNSFKKPPSRSESLKNPMVELKPLEMLDGLFAECRKQGELLASQGFITLKDIEDCKSNKTSGRVVSVGLPAYCLLQTILRSVKANSTGLLLSDNVTEVSSSNRPKDVVFDWFFNPLQIIKDQIKAENLCASEEEYLSKLVLFTGDSERLKNSYVGSLPEPEIRRAEFDALGRRLLGITKSISRYPTFRRRFENLIGSISEELARKNGSGKSMSRSKSALVRIFSQQSFKGKDSSHGRDTESQLVGERDVEIGS